PSAIGKLVRSGRSIRTPSFSLTTGRLYYLVRGVGQAYAAVGQHTLINGPLHAQLVAGIKTGEAFQWVDHDLTAYKGQLAHVEFTAAGGHVFEIAMVVQAERPPVLAERPHRALQRVLAGDVHSLQTLSAGYQHLFLDLCDKLAVGRLAEQPDAIEW